LTPETGLLSLVEERSRSRRVKGGQRRLTVWMTALSRVSRSSIPAPPHGHIVASSCSPKGSGRRVVVVIAEDRTCLLGS
jgi:hypothetical protein